MTSRLPGSLKQTRGSGCLSWTSCQIRKIAGCACAGNAGNVFPASASKRSRHASLLDARAVMHAGVANWRFPLKSVAGKTFPAFPAHAQHAILRIWQEAHGNLTTLRGFAWGAFCGHDSSQVYRIQSSFYNRKTYLYRQKHYDITNSSIHV